MGHQGERQDPARRQFETHVATQEIYEAATLPSRPYGELLPSEQPRLSFAERVPVGVVGVISPFNFPQILAIRSVAPALALGNAVVLKPDPRTAGLRRRRAGPGLRGGRACPTACCTCCRAAPDAGEALITDPLVRIISFTGSTAAGRRVGELAARHLKRVHLELGGNSALVILDDAESPRRLGRRLGLVPAPGADLHDDGQAPGARGRLRRLRRPPGREGRHLPVGDPASGQVALGPIIDERQRDKVHALVTGQRRRRGQAGRGRDLRGPVLPAHGAGRRDAADARLRQRGVRPGRPGDQVLHRWRRRPSSPPTPSTGCRSASSPGT